MRVGFNYSVSYNRFGSEIGPDLWVADAEWDARNQKETLGRVADIPLPPLFNFIDRNLANLSRMKVSVVRWFLLGHGNNYGPRPIPFLRVQTGAPRSVAAASRYPDYNFAPPAKLDARFRRDFVEMLTRFKNAGMQIIPSLISFEFSSAQRFTTGPRTNTGAAGRADIIRDLGKQSTFLDTVLDELLQASIPFKDQIYAWEIVNEPVWMYLDIGANSYPRNWVQHVPEVAFNELKTFLENAVQRIDKAGFKSTVGHRYYSDLSRLPSGTAPQFHYYADNSTVRWVTSGLGYPADPGKIAGSQLFTGNPKPFVGEFGSDHNVGLARAWLSDFSSGDSTRARLELLAKEGCDLALIWPDRADSATADPIKLQQDTRKAIIDFTGGTLPPADQ
ncbi:MAG: hypothetical protein H8K03_12330 [Nitrospira sp.]